MDELMSGLTFAAALGAGLVAGIFFAFSVFIMAALKRLPPEGGISAMQSINVTVLNPAFFFVFFGTAVAALILAIAAFAAWSPARSPYLLAGSLLYLGGTIWLSMCPSTTSSPAPAQKAPRARASGRHIFQPGRPGIMCGRLPRFSRARRSSSPSAREKLNP
jgi:uncharacterized membrane protein